MLNGTVKLCQVLQTSKVIQRPDDGLGFLWRKSAGLKVKLIDVENSHRVMVLELLSGNRKLIIVGVYLPYFVNSDEFKVML